MSHFTVLVIGPDAEAQLAPYCEQDKEYFRHSDVTNEYRRSYERYRKRQEDQGEPCKDFTKYCSNDYDAVPFGEMPPEYGGYTQLDADGNVKAVYNFGNPDRKWDWYCLGGRWTGFFKLLPGRPGKLGEPGKAGMADEALYGDIDWSAMRAEGEDAAGEHYDKAMEILGWPAVPSWRTWDEVRREYIADDMTILKEGGIDKVRQVYATQRGVKLLADAGIHNADQFLICREQYVREGGIKAYQTYALVKDGKWYGQGTMGWWGMSSGDKAEWPEVFERLLHEGTTPDTLIAAYDCHI